MMGRNRRKEKGASAVEFALAMPILFILVFGVFEFGMAFWRKQMLTAAVREGARAGVVMVTPRVTPAKIKEKVEEYLEDAGLTEGVVPTPTPCANSDDILTVTATYPSSMQFVSGLSAVFWGTSAVSASKTVTASISMQCE